MSEHKIKMVLRKEQKWGRDLFYPVNRDDVWILGLLRQKSMTRENINFLKMTNRFEFELKPVSYTHLTLPTNREV